MSLIVVHPAEGVIIADRFILDSEEDDHGVTHTSVTTEDKIKITEDGYIAYCFEGMQYQEALEALFSFVIRYETGVLLKDEKPPKFELDPGNDFKLVIMTKRACYRFHGSRKGAGPTLVERKVPWLNSYAEYNCMAGLSLTALEMFEAVKEFNTTWVTKDYQVVKQTQLKLIKVKRGKK